MLYAATQYDIPLVSGMTGVQAPQNYPYYPTQLKGLLGAIKGAAEYEFIVNAYVRENRVRDMLLQNGVDAETSRTLSTELAQIPAWTTSAAASSMTPKVKAELIDAATGATPGEFLEGQRRMGPQLFAHLLMVLLIILGNVIFFAQRRRGGAA